MQTQEIAELNSLVNSNETDLEVDGVSLNDVDPQDLISDEDTCLKRAVSEIGITSDCFIETMSALHYSMTFRRLLAKALASGNRLDLDILLTYQYLAARFDERGAPSAL